MLTQEEVKHIADLARLELSEAEVKKYQAQLGKILDYMEKLKEVKVKGVATADGGTRELENVWRSDAQPTTSNQQQATDLINAAPEVETGQVKVKSVF